MTALAVTAATAISAWVWHNVSNGHLSSTQGQPVRVAAVNLGQCPPDCQYSPGSYIFPGHVFLSSTELRKINGWLESINEFDRYGDWARANGGVDVGEVGIQVALVGNVPQGVTIMNMQPVGQCTAPLMGTFLSYGTAGEVPSIPIGFNLDKPGAPAQELNFNGTFGRDYFLTHTVQLKFKEQQVFQFAAVTYHRYCEFKIMMTLLVDGKSQVSETFGNGNSPFKVTGLAAGNYAIEYETGMNSPCLGYHKPNGGLDIGMIKPRVLCLAS